MSIEQCNETRGRLALETASFFGLTFLISWSLFAIIGYAPAWTAETFGIIHTPPGMVGDRSPLWYLAVYAPSLSALALTYHFRGSGAVKDLLGRYVRGFRWDWLLVGLFIFPLLAIAGRLALPPFDLDLVDAPGLIVAYLVVVFSLRLVFDPGPLGEELGWRGYALPRLLALLTPFWAAVLLGAVWAIWHLNGFVGPNAVLAKNFSFFAFAAACIAATFTMTWLFIHGRGNLLVCGVATHLALNAMLEAGISRLEFATVAALSLFALGLALFDPAMRPIRPKWISAFAA